MNAATLRVQRVCEPPYQHPFNELTAKKLDDLADELQRFDLEMFKVFDRIGFEPVGEVHIEYDHGLYVFVARFVQKPAVDA
jgi:hypothetical protein